MSIEWGQHNQQTRRVAWGYHKQLGGEEGRAAGPRGRTGPAGARGEVITPRGGIEGTRFDSCGVTMNPDAGKGFTAGDIWMDIDELVHQGPEVLGGSAPCGGEGWPAGAGRPAGRWGRNAILIDSARWPHSAAR